jgi:hypothetical protein
MPLRSSCCCACWWAGTGIASPRAAGAQCPRSLHLPTGKIAQALFAQPLLAAGTPWHSRLQMKHPVLHKLCSRFISLSSPSLFWVLFRQGAVPSSSHAFSAVVPSASLRVEAHHHHCSCSACSRTRKSVTRHVLAHRLLSALLYYTCTAAPIHVLLVRLAPADRCVMPVYVLHACGATGRSRKSFLLTPDRQPRHWPLALRDELRCTLLPITTSVVPDLTVVHT